MRSSIERGAPYSIRRSVLAIAEPRQVTFAQTQRAGLDTGEGVPTAFGLLDGWALVTEGYCVEGTWGLDGMMILSEGFDQ